MTASAAAAPYKEEGCDGVVVAVVGDIIQCRQTDLAERCAARAALEDAMARINRRYCAAVLADFVVTCGGAFHGVLGRPHVIPDIVQDLRERFPRTHLRVAVNAGEPTTALDGRDGVGFAGFGGDDAVLDGIAELLTYHWLHLEDSQREVITALRDCDAPRKDIAARLGISPQALSNRAQSAGWREYNAGLIAWRRLLERL